MCGIGGTWLYEACGEEYVNLHKKEPNANEIGLLTWTPSKRASPLLSSIFCKSFSSCSAIFPALVNGFLLGPISMSFLAFRGPFKAVILTEADLPARCLMITLLVAAGRTQSLGKLGNRHPFQAYTWVLLYNLRKGSRQRQILGLSHAFPPLPTPLTLLLGALPTPFWLFCQKIRWRFLV